jgi:hypothetical protein
MEASLRGELDALKGRYLEYLGACRPADPLILEAGPDTLDLPEPDRLPEAPPPPGYEAPVALEAGPPEPAVGEEFRLPDDPADLSFLEGCWKTDAGLVNGRTGLPIFTIYCFDGNGRAAKRIDEYNRKGRKIRSCVGTATASVTGGMMRMRSTAARCGDGDSFIPATVQCEPRSGGAAQCNIVTASGSRTRIRMTYMGKNA